MIYSNDKTNELHRISGAGGSMSGAGTLDAIDGLPFHTSARAGFLAHTGVSILTINGDVWVTDLDSLMATGNGGSIDDLDCVVKGIKRPGDDPEPFLHVKPRFPVLQGDVSFRWAKRFNVRLVDVCIFKNLLGFGPDRLYDLAPDYFDKIELSSVLSMNYNKNVTLVNVMTKTGEGAIHAVQLKNAHGYVIDYTIRKSGIFATVQFVTEQFSIMFPSQDDGRIIID